jgi:hypothetical protein
MPWNKITIFRSLLKCRSFPSSREETLVQSGNRNPEGRMKREIPVVSGLCSLALDFEISTEGSEFSLR